MKDSWPGKSGALMMGVGGLRGEGAKGGLGRIPICCETVLSGLNEGSDGCTGVKEGNDGCTGVKEGNDVCPGVKEGNDGCTGLGRIPI